MTTELQRVESGDIQRSDHGGGSDHIVGFLERASRDPAIDAEKVRQFLDMLREIRADEAEKAYMQSMSAAQSEMPQIYRDSQNAQTNSRYARLETMLAKVAPIYTKHGFSLSFGTGSGAPSDHVRITCDVHHSSGHTVRREFDIALDTLGPKGLPNKTKVHGLGSSISYARRYLTMMIFNIATNDDDDGNAAGKKPEGLDAVVSLRKELWELLKSVRGPDRNWKVANQWCWDELGSDQSRRIEDYDADGLRALISKAKKCLATWDAHTKDVLGKEAK